MASATASTDESLGADSGTKQHAAGSTNVLVHYSAVRRRGLDAVLSPVTVVMSLAGAPVLSSSGDDADDLVQSCPGRRTDLLRSAPEVG